jgi:deoxycytidylate deaminase
MTHLHESDVDKRMMDVALLEADKSNCLKVHFGAVIHDGNDTILGRGHNRALERFHVHCLKPKGYHLGSNPGLCKAVHAEWDAIHNAVKRGYGYNDLRGATVYVAGKYPDGWIRHHAQFSCTVCTRILKLWGIREIVQYNNQGEIVHLPIDEAWTSAYEELKQGGAEVIA